jgi:peptidyl-prolyl cis-trans isomerase SurA
MKRKVTIALGVAAALSAASLFAGERVVIEAVLVRVNDRIMTVSDFQQRLQIELSQAPAPPSGEALRDFALRLFNSTVDEMVLLERAHEKRLSVDDEMVDRQIDGLRKDNDLLDDEQFEQALRGAGMTVEQLRARYRHQMLITRAAQSEITPTEITEEELRQSYEANKDRFRIPAKVELEQLFFATAGDGSDRDQVLRLATGLVDRVRQGSDMRAEATLAGIEMQELGAIPEGDLRQDLRAVLEGLNEGELTNPLDTGGGVQVIRLVRRIPAGYQPFEEVRESIRRQKSLAAYDEQTRGVVERLKSEYLVEIHEERLAQLISSIGGAA